MPFVELRRRPFFFLTSGGGAVYYYNRFILSRTFNTYKEWLGHFCPR